MAEEITSIEELKRAQEFLTKVDEALKKADQSAGVYLVKISTPRGDMAIRKVQRVVNSCGR